MYPGDHAESTPEKPAIVMGGSGEVVTYAEINARANQLVRLLRDAGLSKGDHIALFMENQPRFMEVVLAALRSGLYVTAINSFLTAPELSYIVNDCRARVLISSAAKAPVVAALQGEDATPGVHTRLMVDGVPDDLPTGGPDGFAAYEEAIGAFSGERLPDETMGATMLYSSGTTGRPKGILGPLPPYTPSENPGPAALAVLFGYEQEMTYLSPAPMYHAAPLAFSSGALSHGGTVVVMERFDPADALALIERHRVTHSQWVPTMFSRMLKLPEEVRSRHDLSSHRVAIHAAAPCPVPVKREMIEWWGPILLEYYAGTEGNGSTFINSEDWLKKPGSVGRAMATKLHIVDENGNDLPPGEEGTVCFSGGGEFEYHNAPEKTAESRLGEGRTTLGDVGYVDEDGYLFLTDRKAYMIISGGVNIYPREIEDHLITHPKVADVAVFGVPNEDFGEEVKAVVQPAEGVEGDEGLTRELLDYCREELARFKVPRSIDYEAELPRLPTGKLYKRLLRDRYWGGKESRIV
jgi:acyl-CoA synthetase (AMP-forming)/AMP-acid ligase II